MFDLVSCFLLLLLLFVVVCCLLLVACVHLLRYTNNGMPVTPQFLAGLNDVYALNRKAPVTIAAPFVDYAKGDLLKIGLELDVDYGKTWSCYEGGALACGRCPTCAERRQAFTEAGLIDPVPYVD